jgi:hypothetical protein
MRRELHSVVRAICQAAGAKILVMYFCRFVCFNCRHHDHLWNGSVLVLMVKACVLCRLAAVQDQVLMAFAWRDKAQQLKGYIHTPLVS